MAFVETKIRPTSQHPKAAQDCGRMGSEDHCANAVEEDEKSGEMLHAHFNESLEDGHRVLRHQLLEGNEKRRLDGYSAAYGNETKGASVWVGVTSEAVG